ncbi:DUF3592 domain-containing protein [Patescibacteria group bacterium]|nr:DUF3592 domain-containing protein [Patescibacteria group bacterium]
MLRKIVLAMWAIGLVLIVLGVMRSVAHLKVVNEYRRLERIAKIGVATIVERSTVNEPGNVSGEYLVIYEYGDSQGRIHRGYSKVKSKDCNQLSKGDKVHILYDPDDPKYARIAGIPISDQGREVFTPINLGICIALLAWLSGLKLN